MSFQQFKNQLDKFLECYPDQPHLEGYIPEAVDLDGTRSNSLVDWIRKLGSNINYTMVEREDGLYESV